MIRYEVDASLMEGWNILGRLKVKVYAKTGFEAMDKVQKAMIILHGEKGNFVISAHEVAH